MGKSDRPKCYFKEIPSISTDFNEDEQGDIDDLYPADLQHTYSTSSTSFSESYSFHHDDDYSLTADSADISDLETHTPHTSISEISFNFDLEIDWCEEYSDGDASNLIVNQDNE